MDLIFVHGALVCDGEWWWQKTAELLLERTGIRSRAVAFPSCGETKVDRGATARVVMRPHCAWSSTPSIPQSWWDIPIAAP